MWEFNLVVTLAAQGRFRNLMDELERCGDFRKTEFFGVVLGRVEDRQGFLEKVLEQTSSPQGAFQDLGRVVPVERVFSFRLENFLDRLCQAVDPWLAACAGRRFYVRLERRGLKGQIVSPEAERFLDAYIEQELARKGESARVDFSHPDVVIAVETIGDRCGVGLLSRETLERYPFVWVG